jgi:hypothetical protein
VTSAQKRFANKTGPTAGGCVEWLASKNAQGYGTFWLDGEPRLAHRVAWSWARGEIAGGLEVNHRCRNKGCVNPEHMELLSKPDHGALSALAASSKNECVRGHAYAPENTYRTPAGRRQCVECKRAAVRRHRAMR